MEGLTFKKQIEVNELDRINTITLLYEGAANFTRSAKKKLEVGDTTGKKEYIRKTSAIIQELSRSLSMDGGEVAQNLKKLYDYILDCLITAETQSDLKPLDDAEKVLEILRNGWREMQGNGSSNPV